MDIKLKDFEGPLDLLLHLVSKYQVDIYEVPITEVIEQYLAYVATLQAMRLEVEDKEQFPREDKRRNQADQQVIR